MIKKVSWEFLKNISNKNNIPITYTEDDLNQSYYALEINNGSFDLASRILITDPRNSDQIDFEDNYKQDANILHIPHVNRIDIDDEFLESGESQFLNTWGFPAINSSFVFELVSGEGYIQAELQASDDKINWSKVLNTRRFTGNGIERFQAVRMAGKFYRYNWVITGTVTFNIKITTTLKNFSTNRISSINNYEDIDLSTTEAISSEFFAADSPNVSMQIIRGADAGGECKYTIESSNDKSNWNVVLESTSLLSNASISAYFSQQSSRWYRVKVAVATIESNITADILWSGTG